MDGLTVSPSAARCLQCTTHLLYAEVAVRVAFRALKRLPGVVNY
jgi:hypothetical protein